MRSTNEKWAALVPELSVSNIEHSLRFWCNTLGFTILYERREEFFAYLELGDAQIMLEQRNPEDNLWETAKLEKPYGRGINFQLEVDTVQSILTRLEQENHPLFIPLEERWYGAGELEFGQKQFLVQDPDGYLVRLIENIGERKRE
ncbi:bleomycin resistance protein [Myroides odoratus]|uniref:bleomycin resistance protein n=1 Tax=Myroides odoratus TaxID=256 RepID=UPI0039AFDCE7